jgi:hypothetical protein
MEDCEELQNLTIIKNSNKQLKDYEFLDECLAKNVFFQNISKQGRFS